MGILRSSYLIALFGSVIVSVISEKCNTILDGQLLVVEGGTILNVDPLDYNNREVYVSTTTTYSKLAYSYRRNTLYYTDWTTRNIYALQDKSMRAPVVAINKQIGKWLPRGISIDDVNDKLYLAEAFAGVLYAYDLESGDNTVLIGTNITDPKDVEIDADEGYLFVLDKFQILKAELDGSNPTPIYEEFATIDQLLEDLPEDIVEAIIESLYPHPNRTEVRRKPISVSDMALDVKSKRIYWINTFRRTVESADYNGENKIVHFKDTGVRGQDESDASVTLLNGVIYWTDEITKKVYKIDADKSQVIRSDSNDNDIIAIDCKKRPTVDNPCAYSPCQQFCLPSKSSQTGYSCACKIGFELDNDGKTCNLIKDYLLFTYSEYLRGESLNDNHREVIDPTRFPVGAGSQIVFDANLNTVYYSSFFPNNKLHEIQLNGEMRNLTPNFWSKDSSRLAYDWTTKNLYYLSHYYANTVILSVTNVIDPTYSKVININVPGIVRGLMVHPNKGYLFYATWDDESRQEPFVTISRLSTDGSGLKVIVDLGFLNGIDLLAVDFDEDRIYWAETKTSKVRIVRHSDLDGQDIRHLNLPTSLKDTTNLAIYRNYIYGINEHKLLYRVDKNGENLVHLINGEYPDSLIGDLKIFDHALQITRPDHPCKSHNCSKLCFAVPIEGSNNLKRVCGCPYGEKIANDGVSCIDNSKEEPAFLPCDYSFKCNFQTV